MKTEIPINRAEAPKFSFDSASLVRLPLVDCGAFVICAPEAVFSVCAYPEAAERCRVRLERSPHGLEINLPPARVWELVREARSAAGMAKLQAAAERVAKSANSCASNGEHAPKQAEPAKETTIPEGRIRVPTVGGDTRDIDVTLIGIIKEATAPDRAGIWGKVTYIEFTDANSIYSVITTLSKAEIERRIAEVRATLVVDDNLYVHGVRELPMPEYIKDALQSFNNRFGCVASTEESGGGTKGVPIVTYAMRTGPSVKTPETHMGPLWAGIYGALLNASAGKSHLVVWRVRPTFDYDGNTLSLRCRVGFV